MYSDAVEEQFHIHEAAISEAREQNDRITSLQHQLEEIALLEGEHKGLQFRYDGFYVLFEVLMAQREPPWPLPKSFVTLLTNKFIQNTEEPVFFRAIASYILGYNYESLDSLTSIDRFQSTITFCKEATELDRERQVELPDFLGDSGTKSVGEILDSLVKDSTFRRDFQKDPIGTHGTLLEMLSKAGACGPFSQPGEAEEIMQLLSDFQEFMPKKPPPSPPTSSSITAEEENAEPQHHPTPLTQDSTEQNQTLLETIHSDNQEQDQVEEEDSATGGDTPDPHDG